MRATIVSDKQLRPDIIEHKWESLYPGFETFPQNSPMWKYINNPVDLVFADPPYNYGVAYADDPTFDNVPTAAYRKWVNDVVFVLTKMIKKGGTLWWLCPADDGDWTWWTMKKYGSLLYGKPIIWYERFSQYQKKRLTSDYRLLFPLIVGATESETFNPDCIRERSVRQEMGDKRADPRGRVPGHVWQVRRLQGTSHDRVDWHPVQLPPEPLMRIVCGWTNLGDTVLDAFAGSGNMGLVCQKARRKFVGVEQSPTYCKKMRERLSDKD